MWIDKSFFGIWVFTPWQFLQVNVAQKISLFYGNHPWHFYFIQAIPLIFLTFLPLTCWGWYRSRHDQKRYGYLCLFIISVLSCLGHKEFRFLLPILPLGLVFAGLSLAHLEKMDTIKGRKGGKSLLLRTLIFLLVTNASIAFYLSFIHKRGQVEVTHWIRHEASQDRIQSVLFLMPCHSTPFYSQIHFNITMRMLTCEPPLGIKNKKNYVPEDDLFYNDPEAFIDDYFVNQTGAIKVMNQEYTIQPFQWSSHVVWFDNHYLRPVLIPKLEALGYRQVKIVNPVL